MDPNNPTTPGQGDAPSPAASPNPFPQPEPQVVPQTPPVPTMPVADTPPSQPVATPVAEVPPQVPPVQLETASGQRPVGQDMPVASQVASVAPPSRSKLILLIPIVLLVVVAGAVVLFLTQNGSSQTETPQGTPATPTQEPSQQVTFTSDQLAKAINIMFDSPYSQIKLTNKTEATNGCATNELFTSTRSGSNFRAVSETSFVTDDAQAACGDIGIAAPYLETYYQDSVYYTRGAKDQPLVTLTPGSTDPHTLSVKDYLLTFFPETSDKITVQSATATAELTKVSANITTDTKSGTCAFSLSSEAVSIVAFKCSLTSTDKGISFTSSLDATIAYELVAAPSTPTPSI